jgi:hypothetical protein
LSRKQTRADEYRRLADVATALAEASPLDNVREKHVLAAEKWTNLAKLDDRVREETEARESAAEARQIERTQALAQDGLSPE